MGRRTFGESQSNAVDIKLMERAPFELRLSPSPFAPKAARDAVSEWLRRVPCDEDTLDAMVLAVSELVTNAVVHAGAAPRITAVFDEGWLRLAVHDDSVDPPTVRPPGEAGGFGLRIVSRVADGWGWTRTDAGKQVWVEVLC